MNRIVLVHLVGWPIFFEGGGQIVVGGESRENKLT